jgi:transportin-1
MWEYDSTVLREITSLISDAVSSADNLRQQEIASKVSELSQDSQFPCYLLHILTNSSLSITIRLASGHTLKSILERAPILHTPILNYIQETVIRSLLDNSISSAICSIASTLYITQEGWPQLLNYISQNMNNSNSLAVLAILFEEISTYSALAYLLDSPSYSESVKQIILQLLDLAKAQNPGSFKVMNQLLKIMPTVLMPNVSNYLQTLLSVSLNDFVAEGIFLLSSMRKDIVKRDFQLCAERILDYMTTEKGGLGCNFWMEFISEKDLILPYLERLLLIVISNLKLTDTDIMMIMPETEEYRFEKEEYDKNWGKRRESAVLLDNLGQSFGGQCFVITQNAIQNLLLSANWIEVESGLLSLGALASGASEALIPSLPVFLPFLLKQTENQEKLVVAMSLWTISRFTDYIIGTSAFPGYLESIIKSMMSKENIVQQAACTAFCILITRNPESLQGYLDYILQVFNQCLGHYRGKALINLLDAVGSVVDILGETLKQDKYINLLFSPVIILWNKTQNNDRLIWTLSESLTSIVLCMGSVLQEYMQPLFNRSCALISLGLSSAERQFAVKGFELAGVIIESSVSININEILPLLVQSLSDKDVSVKQYASATVGDIVYKKYSEIHGYIQDIIPKLLSCLFVIEGPDDISSLFSLACNNAALALSEISISYPADVQPYTLGLVKSIVICGHKTSLPQVKANLMCCLGKLGNNNPEAVASHLNDFLYTWCETINFPQDPYDKIASFKGICQALMHNIKALDSNFQYFAECVLAYTDMPDDVRWALKIVLQQVKALAGDSWEAFVGQLPYRKDLLVNFQV